MAQVPYWLFAICSLLKLFVLRCELLLGICNFTQAEMSLKRLTKLLIPDQGTTTIDAMVLLYLFTSLSLCSRVSAGFGFWATMDLARISRKREKGESFTHYHTAGWKMFKTFPKRQEHKNRISNTRPVGSSSTAAAKISEKLFWGRKHKNKKSPTSHKHTLAAAAYLWHCVWKYLSFKAITRKTFSWPLSSQKLSFCDLTLEKEWLVATYLLLLPRDLEIVLLPPGEEGKKLPPSLMQNAVGTIYMEKNSTRHLGKACFWILGTVSCQHCSLQSIPLLDMVWTYQVGKYGLSREGKLGQWSHWWVLETGRKWLGSDLSFVTMKRGLCDGLLEYPKRTAFNLLKSNSCNGSHYIYQR